MNIMIVLALIVLILLLAIYSRALSYKELNTSEQKEIQLHHKIIETTEELLAGGNMIPYSPELSIVLHSRIVDALQELAKRTSNSDNYRANIESRIKEIEALRNSTAYSVKSIKPAENDARAIMMLRLINRINKVLRTQYGKGLVNYEVFISEKARLESIRVQIVIENALKRAALVASSGNHSLSVVLLKKAIKLVSSGHDDYSIRILPELENKLLQAEQSLSKSKTKQETKQEVPGSLLEIDRLFDGKKRGWDEKKSLSK